MENYYGNENKLWYYINSSNIEAFRKLILIDKDSISKCHEAFLYSCGRGEIEFVKLFLQIGVDINQKSHCGSKFTGLVYAACQCNVEVVKLLIEANADINIQDNIGHTALIDASSAICTNICGRGSECGFIKIVKLLVNAGANPYLQTTGGFTAYSYAMKEGNLEIANIIFKYIVSLITNHTGIPNDICYKIASFLV
jgi:ankyrin repeat protein